MMRTQVSFPAESYRRARQEARRRGISFAELCRLAISRLLVEEQPGPSGDRPWMTFAGSIQSGDPATSRSIDAIVYGRERP